MILSDIEVRTELPASQWRHLEGIARETGTTVAAIVREIVRRQFAAGTFGPPTSPPPPPLVVAPLDPPAPPPPPVRRDGRLAPDVIEGIRAMNAQGMSDTDIARVIGRDKSTVSKYRRQLDLPPRSSGGGRRAVPVSPQ